MLLRHRDNAKCPELFSIRCTIRTSSLGLVRIVTPVSDLEVRENWRLGSSRARRSQSRSNYKEKTASNVLVRSLSRVFLYRNPVSCDFCCRSSSKETKPDLIRPDMAAPAPATSVKREADDVPGGRRTSAQYDRENKRISQLFLASIFYMILIDHSFRLRSSTILCFSSRDSFNKNRPWLTRSTIKEPNPFLHPLYHS